MSEANPTSILRSIGAVLGGVFTVIVLSLATDVVLHATGIYPPQASGLSITEGS